MLTRTELAWLRQAAEAGFHATPGATLGLLDQLDASAPVSPLQVAVHRAGYTATTLAAELGCSRSHVARVLQGNRRFSRRLQDRLTELGIEDTDSAPAGYVAMDPLQLLGDLVASARMVLGLPPTCPPVVVIEAVARTLGRALLDLHVPDRPELHAVPDTLPLPFEPEG